MLFLISSCTPEDEVDVERFGMKPLYISTIADQAIESEDIRFFDNLGKIVYADSLLYINEHLEGIHVIDMKDPTTPEKIAFFNVPGNLDFTINGNLLYADSGVDLLVINIEDTQEIQLINRVPMLYSQSPADHLRPPNYSGPFECVDTTLGTVVGWEGQLLTNPKCFQ